MPPLFFWDLFSTEDTAVDSRGEADADSDTPRLIDETDSRLRMWHEDGQKRAPVSAVPLP